MTKETLLNELNRNNEFNELTPLQVSSILNKPVFVINKVNVEGNMLSSEDVNCMYLTGDKEYTLDMSVTLHGSQFSGMYMYVEGVTNDWVSIRDYISYDSELDSISINLPSRMIEEAGSKYIDLKIDFSEPR